MARRRVALLASALVLALATPAVAETAGLRLAQRGRLDLTRRIDVHARWVYLSLFALAGLVSFVL